MTHITFGIFRAGVRDKAKTLASYSSRPPIPTPYPSASASIVRFHREGGDAAWLRLDRSLSSSAYWGKAGTPQAGWADSIRSCFRIYRALAEPDPRPAFATGVNRELILPPDDIGIYIDVVLLDPRGYVPRIVLWDSNDLSHSRAVLYAAPAWQALEQELGEDRVAGVEVWKLRSGDQELVTPNEAAAAMSEVEEVAHRVAGTGS
jgi:hypothetical protein